MPSLTSEDDEEVTEAKGINKKIKHKKFVDVFFINKSEHNVKIIQGKC